MRFVSVRACLGLGVCLALGCGLRSEPLFVADTDAGLDGSSDSGDSSGDASEDTGTEFPPPVEGRDGSCTNPIELPTTDTRVMGELRGPGLYTTQCGASDGLEDIYIFNPPSATDVTITFDPVETDFSPMVQVSEFGCGPEAVVLRKCTDDWFEGGAGDSRHFIAPGNRPFYIAVDSNGGGGRYAFDVSLQPVELAECGLHPEVITQQVGARFEWQNDFSGGQGEADSFCGGVGRENFFALEMFQPGWVSISAAGSGGFRPVLSVRNGCSALTEIECTNDQILGTIGSAELRLFLDPGNYFLDVDTMTLDAGGYALSVAFE
jgi:hypothetical protein